MFFYILRSNGRRPLDNWFSLPRFLFSKRKREIFLSFVGEAHQANLLSFFLLLAGEAHRPDFFFSSISCGRSPSTHLFLLLE